MMRVERHAGIIQYLSTFIDITEAICRGIEGNAEKQIRRVWKFLIPFFKQVHPYSAIPQDPGYLYSTRVFALFLLVADYVRHLVCTADLIRFAGRHHPKQYFAYKCYRLLCVSYASDLDGGCTKVCFAGNFD